MQITAWKMYEGDQQEMFRAVSAVLCPTLRFTVLLMFVEKSITRIVSLAVLLMEAHLCSL